MSVVLQVTFDNPKNLTTNETFPISSLAIFEGVPGFQWKIWGLSDDKKETGIYLFNSHEAAEGYLKEAKPYLEKLGYENIKGVYYTVNTYYSRGTKAPIDTPANPVRKE
jgi:hypothetical protein